MLLKEGEDASALKKLPPETILIRWLNFHMQASPGCAVSVTNFGSDMQSGEVYVRLLNRLDAEKCPLSLLEYSPEIRADRALTSARALGIPVMVRREDILTGNKRLNLAFCAQIFNTDHGMRFPTPEVAASAAEGVARVLALFPAVSSW
jgi:plastin-1